MTDVKKDVIQIGSKTTEPIIITQDIFKQNTDKKLKQTLHRFNKEATNLYTSYKNYVNDVKKIMSLIKNRKIQSHHIHNLETNLSNILSKRNTLMANYNAIEKQIDKIGKKQIVSSSLKSYLEMINQIEDDINKQINIMNNEIDKQNKNMDSKKLSKRKLKKKQSKRRSKKRI
jgi:hypothetical protein